MARAAKARNEIAHARPLVHGGTVTVVLDLEKKGPVQFERTEKGRMELRKRTKAGETIWMIDQMYEEHQRTEKLFRNLIGFVKLLQGETPPQHLLDGLEG